MNGQDICSLCETWKERPDLAPGRWTWLRGPRGGWLARCWLQEPGDAPSKGDTIRIHRKDGTVSTHAVAEDPTVRLDQRSARWICVAEITDEE